MHKRKVPFIEQRQKTECGLCCVAMISSYYNHEVTVNELQTELETGRDGTSFTQLADLLEAKGFKTNGYKVNGSIEKLPKDMLPAIVFWNKSHFVVLESVGGTHCSVLDPEYGRMRYRIDEFNHHFTKYLLTVDKTNQVENRKVKEDYSKIYKMIFKLDWSSISLVVTTLLMYMLSVAMPVLIRNVVNDLSNSAWEFVYKKSLSLLLMFSLFYLIISSLREFSSINLENSIDRRMNETTISKLFRLPYDFFSKRSKGDLVYSLNSLPNIRSLFTSRLLMGSLDLGVIVIGLIYLLRTDLLIGALTIGLVGVSLSLLFLTRTRIDQNNRAVILSQNILENKQIEIIYSMLGIKMEGFEEEVHQQWQNSFDKYLYRYKVSSYYSSFVRILHEFISLVSPLLVLVGGFYLFGIKKIDLGTVLASYSFASMIFGKVSSVFDTVTGFIHSKAFMRRLNDILESEEEKTDGIKHDVKGSIRIDDVSFSYTKDSEKVLNNVSMSIRPGEKIAIVGPSGSGKSTLSKVLVALYKPSQGAIYFDGVSESDIDAEYLRKQIGIVPQDMTLFNKSILDNITNDREVKMEDVYKVCKMVNIHDEILEMPMGYETLVSEMGLNLSGGQRQRIVLARALLKKPKIILLDEATSYLDNINEKQVMDVFKNEGITTIVIAHRLSTILDSDNIYVLDQGEIVEKGTHEELMRLEGQYYQMYETEVNEIERGEQDDK